MEADLEGSRGLKKAVMLKMMLMYHNEQTEQVDTVRGNFKFSCVTQCFLLKISSVVW